MAGRAGSLKREKALRVPQLAVATAGRARLRLGAGLGAAAGTDLAGDRGRDAHLRGLAVKRLLQRDFHIVAQVGTAFATRAAAAATAHAEKIVEDVGKGRGEVGAEPCPSAL